MRALAICLAAGLLSNALAAPHELQQPLRPEHHPPPTDGITPDPTSHAKKPRPLTGRFLHITDLHLDPFYKRHAATDGDEACHGGVGAAGFYGAERTDCDSPLALINATFDWIAAHVVDDIDFVIWTGDSARHDNDERHPRSPQQVLDLNAFAVAKFREVFGAGDAATPDTLTVPVVPTFGNNDILPHNVFFPGPNRWTHAFLELWRPFIPEAQRHSFATGGWFWVEVIPARLAVVSLNALYFFDSNSAVDGCADRDEPGFQHFEWLRVQLQLLRRRGMKAILIGHVPPARTARKHSWDESCWQKYTLWLERYRDVVVTSVWGHMNIDHFFLHDNAELDLGAMDGSAGVAAKGSGGDEMTVQSSADYLDDLRQIYQGLPQPPGGVNATGDVNVTKKGKKKKKKHDKYLARIGGEWAERYSLGLVGPSIVPNYFPTLRIVEYNISGVEAALPDADTNRPAPVDKLDDVDDGEDAMTLKKKFKQPKGPSKSAPPGPAYSPQSLTLLGWQQFFANLTYLNNEASNSVTPPSALPRSPSSPSPFFPLLPALPTNKHKPRPFAFALEYATANDSVYQLDDLTVRSWLRLAQRLGKYRPPKDAVEAGGWGAGAEVDVGEVDAIIEVDVVEADTVPDPDALGDPEPDVPSYATEGAARMKATHQAKKSKHAKKPKPTTTKSKHDKKKKDKKKKKKEKKERKERQRNQPWLTFLRRAFVGAKDVEDVLRKGRGQRAAGGGRAEGRDGVLDGDVQVQGQGPVQVSEQVQRQVQGQVHKGGEVTEQAQMEL